MLESLVPIAEDLRRRFIDSRDEQGASAVEYGLLLAGIAALIAGAVFAYSGAVVDLFNDSCTGITTQIEGAPANCANP